MTATGEFIIAEGAVTTAAILAAVGYLYKQNKFKDVKLWRTIAKLLRRTENNKKAIVELQTSSGHMAREVPQLKETLTIAVSELDNHLLWHERNRQD